MLPQIRASMTSAMAWEKPPKYRVVPEASLSRAERNVVASEEMPQRRHARRGEAGVPRR